MLYNILDYTQKRCIHDCNFNQHIRSPHWGRIMADHDLIYIKEGTWNLYQDDIRYDLIPGDVILLQGFHYHYGRPPCDSIVKTCFVHFNSCENDTVSADPSTSSDHFVFPMVVHCAHNPLVEKYFHRLIYNYWSDDDFSLKKASSYLDLLLCEISNTKQSHSQYSFMVDDIKTSIRKTPDRIISNQEFADKYCCSVRTLTSKFKEETGCSLHAWQLRLKCQMADELMKCDSSLTLKEIALTFGFYDEYHFSKCFKQYYGYSPKRKRI